MTWEVKREGSAVVGFFCVIMIIEIITLGVLLFV